MGLLDIRLPGTSGTEVLREIWLNHGDMATIMVTAVNDIDTVVLAMRWGASDYIAKPFDLDRVDTSIRTALETKKAAKKPSEMDAIARGLEAKYELLSGSSYMVTHKTIEIAQQLGIADEEIQGWVDARARLDFERNRIIASSLNKVKQSTLA